MARNEKVTRVIDGDTFKTSIRRNSVRLANVYAPERRRPGAAAATNALRSLIGGKIVRIQTIGRSYGRAVAEVWIDGRSVNAIMRKIIRKIRR